MSSSIILVTSSPFRVVAFGPAAPKSRNTLRISLWSCLSKTMASVDTGLPIGIRYFLGRQASTGDFFAGTCADRRVATPSIRVCPNPRTESPFVERVTSHRASARRDDQIRRPACGWAVRSPTPVGTRRRPPTSSSIWLTMRRGSRSDIRGLRFMAGVAQCLGEHAHAAVVDLPLNRSARVAMRVHLQRGVPPQEPISGSLT